MNRPSDVEHYSAPIQHVEVRELDARDCLAEMECRMSDLISEMVSLSLSLDDGRLRDCLRTSVSHMYCAHDVLCDGFKEES